MTQPEPAPIRRPSKSKLMLWSLGLALLAIVVRAPFAPMRGYTGDQALFVAWAEISRPGSQLKPPGGMGMIYEPRDGGGRRWCNYPPGYPLILRVLATVYDLPLKKGTLNKSVVDGIRKTPNKPEIRWALALFKSPAILCDAMIAALLCWYLTRRQSLRAGICAGALFALAPPIIFDSAIWGQVDSVFMLPLIVALECARRRRIVAMTAWAVIAFLMKAQAAMLAPVFIYMAVDHCRLRPLEWCKIVAAAVIPAAVVILPYWGHWEGMLESYTRAAVYYPYTHLNGFSMWFMRHPLLAPRMDAVGANYVRDTMGAVFGLSFRTMGFLKLILVWLIVIWKLWRLRSSDAALAWAAMLLPLAFFVLSTQMHERYIVPAIAAWLWAFRPSARWWAGFIVVLVVTMLNLMWVWGPGGYAWTDYWFSVLQRPWLGFASGQWCAAALFAVMVWQLLTPPRPSREATPAAAAAT